MDKETFERRIKFQITDTEVNLSITVDGKVYKDIFPVEAWNPTQTKFTMESMWAEYQDDCTAPA